MRARRPQSTSPGGWLLAAWAQCPAASPKKKQRQAAVIRAGCEQGRYWLRAYAVLPEKLVLLIYPLEEPAALLGYFELLAGGARFKLRSILNDANLERAAKYVESLPVRSQLAVRPEDYPWSSLGWIRAGQRASVITPQGP